MEFQGRFFKFIRNFVRRFNIAQYNTPPREQFSEPAVYICRHSNLKGPIYSMLNLPMEVHPWSYYVFCDRETCRRHYEEYTFSVRYGWGKLRSRICAWLIAPPFTALIKSVGAIPVYRNAMKIYTTFKLSMAALRKGESLLIFPDVNYTESQGDTGTLYDGFLILERMYFKETGKHLPFVPLHISDAKRSLILGEPVCFKDDVPFKEDQQRVITVLHDALNELTELHGI